MSKRRSLQLICLSLIVLLYMIVYRFSIFQRPETREAPSYCVLTSTERHQFMADEENLTPSPYGNGTCAVCHSKKRLSEILTRWDQIARQHNITYMLTYGSLLGSLRNDDVIPWDTDIDIYIESRDNHVLDSIQDPRTFDAHSESFHLVLDADWSVLPVEKRRRLTCNGEVGRKGIWDSCSFQGPVGRLIKGWEQYLDIWDLEVLHDGALFDRYGPGYRYARNDIYPVRACLLGGVATWCPRNPEVVFDAFYGRGKDRRSAWMCESDKWVRRAPLNATLPPVISKQDVIK